MSIVAIGGTGLVGSKVVEKLRAHGREAVAVVQPIAAGDVTCAVCRVALGSPLNGTVEIGGLQKFRLHEWGDDIKVNEITLLPGGDARLGETHFEDWLSPATLVG